MYCNIYFATRKARFTTSKSFEKTRDEPFGTVHSSANPPMFLLPLSDIPCHNEYLLAPLTFGRNSSYQARLYTVAVHEGSEEGGRGQIAG